MSNSDSWRCVLIQAIPFLPLPSPSLSAPHITSFRALPITIYAVTDPIFRSYPTRIPITHICSLIPFVTLFVFLSSSVMFCFLLFLMYVCIVSYHISWIFVLFCFLFVSGLVSSLVISTHIHLLNYSRVFSICFGFDLRYYCWGGSWKGFEVVTALWRNEYGLRYALPMVCEMHASYSSFDWYLRFYLIPLPTVKILFITKISS